jgi:tetratricopeptide (TPR) repeat protein
MVVTFAGRRAQSIDGDLDAVALRIRRLLTALRPSAVVGALADGADLSVAEAALGMADGPRVEVILPTPEEVFREASVAPSWQERFDRALEQVHQRGAIHSLGLEDGPEAYQQANVAFLERASELASNGERAIVLVVAGQSEGKTVEDLVAQARLRNVPALRIDPNVRISEQPRAFVAMPYGKKPDPQRQIDVDCNLVYTKILLPALENAQLNYRRADEEIDSGVVLQPMIEWLADADLVIGDLQTANFNVGWELGLRHLMRPRQTLLIRPAGTIAPFDLNLVRHVVYRSDELGVSDDAAVEAWAALAPYLRSVGEHGNDSDSPVAAVMDVTQWSVVERRGAWDERWESMREQLAYARDAADGDLMLEVLESAPDLDPKALSLLCGEAGVGLVRLARYEDARRLLREVVESDGEVLHPEAHVYYAQALYRPEDASIEAFDAAEKVLRRVLVKRHAHPEVRALLGAIAKRRARSRTSVEEREPDLRLAMESYRYDYERNLSAYYEGINVVAVAAALHLVYGDEGAGASARELLPAIRVAAALAQRSSPKDYWAAVTLAECTLYESLLGLGEPSFSAAYRAAGALRPPRGSLKSTLFQLDFLRLLGLPEESLASAQQGLLAGAGTPSLA